MSASRVCCAFLPRSCTSKLWSQTESKKSQKQTDKCSLACRFSFDLIAVSGFMSEDCLRNVIYINHPVFLDFFLIIFLLFLSLRGDKESWIKSKYVEKKFIQKLPETGRNTLLRRSSARRNRTTVQDRTAQRPPLKPKPNRATLPRVTGNSERRESGLTDGNQRAFKGLITQLVACLLSS